MSKTLYGELIQAKQKNKKKFAVLIDPDKLRLQNVKSIIDLSIKYQVDYFFIGGSLIVNDQLDEILTIIRKKCDIPLVLFPGSSYQISTKADAILFLSLISGRNAELLIGKHVISAPFLKASSLEVIPTGYMLIDGGVPTAVSYISNTQPIPADKDSIAVSTALAGELLGLKLIYLDAGSGAHSPIPSSMIKEVSRLTEIPLIVGGGINSTEKLEANLHAGADLIVVGNALEKQPDLIVSFAKVFKKYNMEK